MHDIYIYIFNGDLNNMYDIDGPANCKHIIFVHKYIKYRDEH